MGVIERTRKDLELSRRQLAKRLGIKMGTIERWENGQAPTLQKLPIIYKVMKITYKQLVEDYKEEV